MIYLNSGIYWFCFQRVEPCQVDLGVVWWHFLRLRHFHSISETPFDSIFGVNRWCRGLIPQPVRYRICLITEWVAQSCPHVPPTGTQPVPICMIVFWWYNRNHQPMIPWSTWIQGFLDFACRGYSLAKLIWEWHDDIFCGSDTFIAFPRHPLTPSSGWTGGAEGWFHSQWGIALVWSLNELHDLVHMFHPLVHSLYRFAWLFSGDILKIIKP